jgi:hypothetical protein
MVTMAGKEKHLQIVARALGIYFPCPGTTPTERFQRIRASPRVVLPNIVGEA